MARRLIGGQTGDILGAAQQLAEIAIYLGLALALGWDGGERRLALHQNRVIDPVSKLCEGCGRTLAEIAQWGRLSEAERLAVGRCCRRGRSQGLKISLGRASETDQRIAGQAVEHLLRIGGSAEAVVEAQQRRVVGIRRPVDAAVAALQRELGSAVINLRPSPAPRLHRRRRFP
jgi:predicted Fe-S protein YdhL (DUF1289 family)